ncbi:dUTP diphosphatase [Arthrobacter sp. Soil763]|uniref:dUTP diphosphatase n=1 Tax=Arthrobacter sp. Soil763 TaxID=1736402 RepID=UPI0006F6CE1D|nr:dUTP diphosphatase [Arthrobacter sp. Soil763]KRE78746.1 deoxyuridine 5'-triphosphate nucleotidohydrolase [Arthrobacter sp. Soil763]
MTEETTAVTTPPAGPAAAYGTPTLTVELKMLDDGLEPPSYAHPGDAGADLRAREDVVLQPGERRLVPTGVSIALPDGFVALIHPRSGLATKHGLTVVNAPGTVDAGYRGEIAVTLLNTDREKAIELRRGDRIAQMVIQRVEYARFVAVQELGASVRGGGGFGSTGGFGPAGTGAPGV